MKDWIKENKEFVGAAVSQVCMLASLAVRLYVPEVNHEISNALIGFFQFTACGFLGVKMVAKRVDIVVSSRISQFEARLTQFEARLRK